MPATPTTQRMGELHEVHLAGVLGATKTKSSGNQWSDPMDTKNHADLLWSFRADGKSTKGKQIAVTLDMIRKAREQAGTRYPALGLRWYGNETLTDVLEDWTAFPDEVTAELLADARAARGLRGALESVKGHLAEVVRERDRLREELEAAQLAASVAEADPESLRRGHAPQAASEPQRAVQEAPREVPQYVPALPWTVVAVTSGPGHTDRAGLRYWRDGSMTSFPVREVRVERSPDSQNRPRLIVNGMMTERGDLYRDGQLVCRVWPEHPECEAG